MKSPFERINKVATSNGDGSVTLDFSKPMDLSISSSFDSTTEEQPKRKRGRPRKNPISDNPTFIEAPHLGAQPANIITDDGNTSERQLSFLETNEPYEKKYQETNNILRSAISQIDTNMVELQGDIEAIRGSRTMKSKYQYLSLLHGSMGTMIGNKISAARELNNTISKCNEFEIKRYKEISAAASDVDDDQKVMDMYRAFVNAPVSAGAPPALPNVNTMVVSQTPMQSMGVGSVDAAFQNYMDNLTPQQTMMHASINPNIQQVVVYNQATGARYFEIMDMSTGQPVPNGETHDAMFLEDVDIDLKNGVARNVNIGETYPLVVVGEPLMQEY